MQPQNFLICSIPVFKYNLCFSVRILRILSQKNKKEKFFDTTPTFMETLDEQLDAANARLTEQSEKLAALETEIATLQATNEELSDNLTHTKEQLASVEGAYRQALEEVQQLKAEAKSAEERAAEYYGKPAAAQPVTAKGDPDVRPVSERFAAIKDPAAQTAFLRSLSDAERAELYNNL